MEKIKLNISGNLVGIKIPSTTVFEIIEGQLKGIVIKNYKLLRTLKFYKIIDSNFSESQILQLEKMIESIVSLKPLEKADESNKVTEKKIDYRFHYGNLRSGEKINSETNVIILGSLNPGSYVKSRKNIFVYGKARGTLHAGCEIKKYQSSFVYIEEAEHPKVRIGEVQLMHDDKELNKNIMFEKKMGKIIIKKLDKNQIKELMKKIGVDLI
ncbi:septum site-determining protein MinC [Psychrilyobacter sp.]|uniref:septum site-determining protein MinC n=1 Tax=Psychrilyobacter sp. TaxID=2586924 RepID=UPI00301B2DE1